MISLLFVLLIVVLFVSIFFIEASSSGGRPRLADPGLITWLTSGNWPAKVGACLLLLGFGALIRYSLIHLALPDEIKLGSGFIISAILAAAACVLKSRPERRAIYVALAGAAAGVAYLTAYSAYGFFHFLSDVSALALLCLVTVITGVFALSANALSIAILAMAGAYIAPAFAMEAPGPLPVYGYYLAVSSLSFVMVTRRGWRPLIHLSFLFTLAGALFFGWTARFYQPEHYAVMQPLLLGLVALHLAMPLVEQGHASSRWLSRFDAGYFCTLPIVAAVLALLIAPTVRKEGAIGFFLLGLLWAGAAAVLYLRHRNEALRHAIVAALLVAAAMLCHAQVIPWILIGLCLAVAAFLLAPRLDFSSTAEELSGGCVLLFGLLHIAASIMEVAPASAFFNNVFVARMFAVLLLASAAWAGGRRARVLARILGSLAAGWAGLAVVLELQRLHFDFIPQLVYGLLLAAAPMAAVVGRRTELPAAAAGGLTLALAACGWWAAPSAPQLFTVAALVFTPAFLLVLAALRMTKGAADDVGSVIALALLPVVLVPWAMGPVVASAFVSPFPGATIIIGAALLSLVAAHTWLPQSSQLHDTILPVHFLVIALGLVGVTTLYIERSTGAIVFECLALAYLLGSSASRLRSGRANASAFGTVTVVTVVLVLQAMVLRVFGPGRVMTVLDLRRMDLPAVLSLVWALLGAGLAWWGVKTISRSIWSAGAALLVVVAVKLSLFDFGSLGQLGNILALIAAGLVFFAVAWLAPIPPKRIAPQRVEPRPKPPATAPSGLGPSPGGSAKSAAAATPLTPSRQVPKTGTAVRQGIPSPNTVTTARRSQAAEPRRGLWVLIALSLVGVLLLVPYFSGRSSQQRRHSSPKRRPLAVPQRQAIPPHQQEVPAVASPMGTISGREQVSPPSENQPAPPIRIADACTNFTDRLPHDYVLYAGGAYKGRELGFPIDQSGHEATKFEVAVNRPGEKVVLALGAYEPSVWDIRWTPGTEIAGVFVSGYHGQVVAGLAPDVPVLHSNHVSPAPCGSFYFDRKNLQNTDLVIRKVFGRPAETYFAATEGRLEFGLPAPPELQFVQSARITVDSYRDPDVPLAGKAGLDQLMEEGKLRLATRRDIDAWREARRKAQSLAGVSVVRDASEDKWLERGFPVAYVVVKPMHFPSELFGAHAATFIVKEGVPVPKGNPGHSTVLDMNSLTCSGPERL